MLNKRKVKAIYILEGICDECGGLMVPKGIYCQSYPGQYPYKCEKCGWTTTYWEQNKPGNLQYELEEEYV